MQRTDHQKHGWPKKVLEWFGLTNEPTVKVYRGYGQSESLTLYGHVFKLSPIPPKRYHKSVLHNTLALLRLFMVKPFADADVELEWEGRLMQCKTDKDGFFKFEWKDEPPLPEGWQEVNVTAHYNGQLIAASKGTIYVPSETQYGFISDIDDTFLISHSSN